MKRIRYVMSIIVFLLMLGGCSRQQAVETDLTVSDLIAAITESQQGLPELMQITPVDEDFGVWLSDYYFLQGQAADGVICYADGVEASEIAVLLMEEEKDCEAAGKALEAYMENRAGVFEGYAPQQAAMVKEGIVVINGKYVVLLICPQPQGAKDAFLGCFGEEGQKSGLSTEEKNQDKAKDAYDAEAVLAAYRSGDSSSLSERNHRILEAAEAVIASEIRNDMSDYEKELAIHDYITGWSRFDYSVFGRSGSDGFTDGSDTPYGVLIDQSAMCHGYSSTFQLFMDMLGIECITVFGLPGGNGVEHSWNMVRLDGEWYCVDCAWDDPIGGSPGYTYFNVTSEKLRGGSIHRWEEGSVPEATGTVYAYGGS